MRCAATSTRFLRWPAGALLFVFIGAATVARAQSAGDSVYGVELRGTEEASSIEVRVGPNTTRPDEFRAAHVSPSPRQPFVVKWSRRDISLKVGGQTLSYPLSWLPGNAVRISARGAVRVRIAAAAGKRLNKDVHGTLILSGSQFEQPWTLEGSIDWPDAPSDADGVVVTAEQQDPTVSDHDPKNRKTFSGGIADPSVFALRGQAPTRQAQTLGLQAVTGRTWTGALNGNWSEGGNWNPSGVPAAGDELTFASGSKTDTMNNDVNPAVGRIVVTNGNYHLKGQGLTLSGSAGTSRIEKDFQVDSLAGSGAIELVGQAILTVGPNGNNPAQGSTTYSGTLTGGNGQLVKDGSGELNFTGNAAGIKSTEVRQGRFFLNGGTLSDVTVTGNEVFAIVGGTVGRLNVRNGGEIGHSSSGVGNTGDFQMEGIAYRQSIHNGGGQQFRVSGTVRISYNGKSSLEIIPGSSLAAGSTYMMVINDGTDAVDGTFDRLLEGAPIDIGGVQFQISYRCNAEASPPRCDGSGNDIGFGPAGGGGPPPDLRIAKSSSGSFVQGQTGTFTLHVDNVGSGPTTGTVTVTDTLPAGFVPTAASGNGWGCGINGQVVTCSQSTVLQNGQAYSDIAIAVSVSLTAQNATNAATVQTTGDSNSSNDSSTIQITVGQAVDLAISKRATNTFAQGATGSYEIVVRNASTAASSGTAAVTVIDTLPSGLTPKTATGAGWSCTINGQQVNCSRTGALNGGQSFDAIAIDADVAANAPATVTNTATVSGGGEASPGSNNTASVTTPVSLKSDLTIAKTQGTQFTPGQTGGVFTITVGNAGPGDTSGEVRVVDTFPAGLTPTSAVGPPDWQCSISGAVVTCTTTTSIAANNSYPAITLLVNVAANVPAQLTNSATVSGGNDGNSGNNSVDLAVSIATGPVIKPDLTIDKTLKGTIAQGGTATFEISVRNLSTSATTAGADVVVTDDMPAALTATAASGSGWNCTVAQSVVCRRTSIGVNGSAPPITITASVSAAATDDTNIVRVEGGGDDTPGNNTDSLSYVVGQRAANLSIDKSHTGSFDPGQQNATFSIVVTNTGQVPTTSAVVVADDVPAGLTPTSASGTGWTCTIAGQHVECTHASALAATESASFAIVTSVAIGASSGTNVAVVSGGGDTTPSNNTDSDAYVVTGSANLTIIKTHTGNFVVGQQGAQYSIEVRNTGGAPTSGDVVVEDVLPVGLTPVSAAGAGWVCTISGQTVECRRGDSLPAQSAPFPTIVIAVNVGSSPMQVTNIATVSGGADTNSNDNSATDPTTVAGTAQLTIIKAHAGPVVQGQQDLPFTIIVTNNGTSATSGAVTVTDTLPGGLTPVDASGTGWSCNVSAPTATCTRSDALAAGADYPAIQIRANVASNAVTVTNEVSVTGGGDTTPADNVFRDQVAITPAGQPNLILSKRHDGDFSQGQQGAVYHLVVTNVGLAPTVGQVTVTDDVPPALTPTSASGAGWACSVSGQHVECSRSDPLAPNNSYPEIALVVNVSPTASDVVNVAALTGGGDQTPGDGTAEDVTHIRPQSPDLTVVKQHDDPFLTGQPDATYQITVRNIGSGPTTGEVVLVDRVPVGLLPLSATGAGWTCAIAGRATSCRRSDPLPPGASYPAVILHVEVQPGASNLVNVATVTGGGVDTDLGNNSDGDATSINVSPDAAIKLTAPPSLSVGTEAIYEALVTNVGQGFIGGQTDVIAVLPAELIPLNGVGSGWSCTAAGQQISCARVDQLGPNEAFSPIRFRTVIRSGPGTITVSSRVSNGADPNPANDEAVVSGQSVVPTASLAIRTTTSTPRVTIGGVAAYSTVVENTGQAIVTNAVVEDLLPRGFKIIDTTRQAVASNRSVQSQPAGGDGGDSIVLPIGTLAAGDVVTVRYQAIVGADARGGRQDNRATVAGTTPPSRLVEAGPATAAIEVVTETFTMLQAVVGRVFEDIDGNRTFDATDRPLANARVITSTGQAALTDSAGMYNIPSIGSGSVAVSLDRDTVREGLTLDDGPGGRSWTRLLRTPIGGGTLLSQNFALQEVSAPANATPAAGTTEFIEINRIPDDPAAGDVAPRRSYETRDGSSLLIALGEVSFGRAAQEFELFERDKDVWGYGSLFYQAPIGSPKNRLTIAADSRRRLNGTTDRDRLFELDPNDRAYPVFGDSSRRQEFATSNSKVFARFERGASHAMFGDLIGDLPSSSTDGGRWSSYQRHLTGVELRLANEKGDHVTLRGAQPETAYAREVFGGGSLGLIVLGHLDVLAGTETVAVEVRDRRMPERLVSRDVLARGVDYQLEPGTGTLFLQRHVSTLDPQLNLVQIVVTYEYENQGMDHLVFNGRTYGTFKGLGVGATFFTEEGVDNDRFSVAGVDVSQKLWRGGHLRVDVPYSHGTPNVATSVNTSPVSAGSDTNGFAVQAEIEQPFAFWHGIARASFLDAEDDFRNPFSATITPGAQLAAASTELSPWESSRFRLGASYERYDTSNVDADRTTYSGEFAQTIAGVVTLKAGYDGRSLDQSGATLDSGLVTGQVIVKAGDRFEARAGREENVKDDTDPTYPDQTTLGARFKVHDDTSLFYTQRLGDAAIVPVGDFASTGFSQLPTKGELNIGVESRVQDTTALTSSYRVEQGINGPDAFALIGVTTQLKLGRDFGASVGFERGQVVSGQGNDYISGSLGVDWLPSDRLRASTRYEMRERGGFTGLLTSGVAARLGWGFTGLSRVQWASSDVAGTGDAVSALAALALRPASNDRVGWLLSYQFVNRDASLPTVAPGRSTTTWRHLASTDGYVQPLKWLQLHGKFAWQRTDVISGISTDTYLSQGRLQIALSRFVDAAIEDRYIYQPESDSSRQGLAAEIGFWPLADIRAAVGYNVYDTRDPLGRDLQGRDQGVYVTLSTKLSHLFNLFGSRPD